MENTPLLVCLHIFGLFQPVFHEPLEEMNVLYWTKQVFHTGRKSERTSERVIIRPSMGIPDGKCHASVTTVRKHDTSDQEWGG